MDKCPKCGTDCYDKYRRFILHNPNGSACLRNQLTAANAKIAALQVVVDVGPVVDAEGVRFGNCWFSFDSITDCGATESAGRSVHYRKTTPKAFVEWAGRYKQAVKGETP